MGGDRGETPGARDRRDVKGNLKNERGQEIFMLGESGEGLYARAFSERGRQTWPGKHRQANNTIKKLYGAEVTRGYRLAVT